MVNREEHDKVLHSVIWSHAKAWRALSEGHSGNEINESLEVAVRKWWDLPPQMASKAALGR